MIGERFPLVVRVAVLGLTAAALGAGFAGALTLASGSEAPAPAEPNTVYTATTVAPRDAPPRPGSGRPAEAIPEVLASAYAVFRAPPGPEDRPSAELAGKLRKLALNPAHARLVGPAKATARRFYAVPGADGMLCFVDDTGAGGCQAPDEAVKWGSIGIDECGPDPAHDQVLVYGLVPDRISIALDWPDGRTRPVSVTGNAWSTLVPRARGERPTHVVSTSDDGSLRIALGYSPDIDRGCPAPG